MFVVGPETKMKPRGTRKLIKMRLRRHRPSTRLSDRRPRGEAA